MLRSTTGSILVGLTLLTACAPAVRKPTAAAPPADPRTVWLIFIDDLHIQFRKTGHLRNLLRHLAAALIEPRDTFAIRTSGPSSIAIDLTSDRTKLDAAISRMSGSGLRPHESTAAEAADEVRYRFRISIFEAEGMLAESAAWTAPRRVMLYLSDGYNVPGIRDRLAAFVAAARRANVAVFTLNTQALPVEAVSSLSPDEAERYAEATRTSLRLMTEGTGGSALLEYAELDASRIRQPATSASRSPR